MAVLQMVGIHKSFSGVQVLRDVSVTVSGGKVLSLLGENGAGKSTLMKILTGEYRSDAGQILIDGQSVDIRWVKDAERLGIGMIHQELNLFSNLSVAENFLVGHEKDFSRGGIVNYHDLNSKVAVMLEQVKLRCDPRVRVSDLGIGERQLLEIAKTLQRSVRFLVMDEPTAALTETETETLFDIIHTLTQRDVGIIYISHRMEELYRISDEVTVLRDGQSIETLSIEEAPEEKLISLMVGRTMDNRYPRVEITPGNTILQANALTSSRVQDIHLEVRAGEVVGLGGLMGSGRTELARVIAGVDRIAKGSMELNGAQYTPRAPMEAIEKGVAYVTEDRKEQGLIPPFSVRSNLALPTLKNRSRLGMIHMARERRFAQDSINRFRVKVNTPEQPTSTLSGGNQQKIVIAKWMACNPQLLILDEPTRGVDVGAKQEIYTLINELKASNKAILLISSDLPELLGLSDRIYVMHEGTISAELQGDQMTQEPFMRAATGGM